MCTYRSFMCVLLSIVLCVVTALHTESCASTQVRGEQSFVVIIPSYNNKDWYENNLQSVYKQHYTNYRVVYIDDVSTDDTYNLVQSHVEALGQGWRTTI